MGCGLPSLASEWPYLVEALGDAAIVYGQGREALAKSIRALDDASLERAATAAQALQPRYDWRVVAGQSWDLHETVGTAKL